jgi:hypothetical protein
MAMHGMVITDDQIFAALVKIGSPILGLSGLIMECP